MNGKIKIISSMLIFGSIGVFVKNLNLSSTEIAFLRAVLGSIFLACAGVFIIRKNSYKAIKNNLLKLVLSGAAIGFNWILLFQGYKYTTVSNATLAYYFAPIFVIILSPLVLKEKLTLLKLLCVASSAIGLFLIVNVGGSNSTVAADNLKGVLFGLTAAVLYAFVILINKFIRGLSGFETTLVQLFVAAMVLLPVILYQSKLNLGVLDYKSVILILILGIVHTGIAYFLYFTSFIELRGQTVAILSYIDPISAVIFAGIFLGESIKLVQLCGGILILGAAFLNERLQQEN